MRKFRYGLGYLGYIYPFEHCDDTEVGRFYICNIKDSDLVCLGNFHIFSEMTETNHQTRKRGDRSSVGEATMCSTASQTLAYKQSPKYYTTQSLPFILAVLINTFRYKLFL